MTKYRCLVYIAENLSNPLIFWNCFLYRDTFTALDYHKVKIHIPTIKHGLTFGSHVLFGHVCPTMCCNCSHACNGRVVLKYYKRTKYSKGVPFLVNITFWIIYNVCRLIDFMCIAHISDTSELWSQYCVCICMGSSWSNASLYFHLFFSAAILE
jgi:hypothetical protein